MLQYEAIEAAMEFAGIEVDAESVTVETRQVVDNEGFPTGSEIFKVELTADIVIWVSDDGTCEYEKA